VLGSDDPLLFGSSTIGEYRTAMTDLDFDLADLVAVARTSLLASLAGDDERDRLVAEHDAYVARWGVTATLEERRARRRSATPARSAR